MRSYGLNSRDHRIKVHIGKSVSIRYAGQDFLASKTTAIVTANHAVRQRRSLTSVVSLRETDAVNANSTLSNQQATVEHESRQHLPLIASITYGRLPADFMDPSICNGPGSEAAEAYTPITLRR